MLIRNTDINEIKVFWASLDDEIKTIDSVGGITIDELLNKAVFVHGVRRNDQLAGVGGLFRSFGFLWTFHVVKKGFQRQGIADEITREFLEYAKGKIIILASIFPWNEATMKMTQKQGYKVMYKDKVLWWLYIPLKPQAESYAKILPFFIRIYNLKPTKLIFKYMHQLKIRGFAQSLKMVIIYLFQGVLTPVEYIKFLCSRNFVLRLDILKKFRFIHKSIKCLHTEGELLNIADYLLKLPKELEGDIIECGTYDGGATCKLSYIACLLDRKVLACDAFEGLQGIEKDEAKYFKSGDYKSLYNKFLSNIIKYGYYNSIEVCAGWFNYTLPLQKDRKFICIFEDADIYNSVKDTLDNLWDGLQPGCKAFTHEMLFTPALKAYKDRGLKVKQVGCWITNSNLGWVKK